MCKYFCVSTKWEVLFGCKLYLWVGLNNYEASAQSLLVNVDYCLKVVKYDETFEEPNKCWTSIDFRFCQNWQKKQQKRQTGMPKNS